MNHFNSTFRVKPGAKSMKRGGKLKRSPMKRSGFKRVPGTARPLKAKPESPAMRRFKREVRERDNFTCQFPSCGRYSKHIDVHHTAKRSQRPDLKHEVSNGICLCREHHGWTDTHHDEAVERGLLNTESYELAKKQSNNLNLQKGDSRMKRKLITLLLTISMLVVLAWTPPSAFCFGCTAVQKQQCRDEANAEFERCMNFYPGADGYCLDQADAVESTCLAIKGCPQPYHNP